MKKTSCTQHILWAAFFSLANTVVPHQGMAQNNNEITYVLQVLDTSFCIQRGIQSVKMMNKQDSSLIKEIHDLEFHDVVRLDDINDSIFGEKVYAKYTVVFKLSDSTKREKVYFIPVFSCRHGGSKQGFYREEGTAVIEDSDFPLRIESKPEFADYFMIPRENWEKNEKQYRENITNYIEGKQGVTINVKRFGRTNADLSIHGRTVYYIVCGLKGYPLQVRKYDMMQPALSKLEPFSF